MGDNLYREELMEIYKHPSNQGVLPNPSVTVHKSNPLCGDEINLQVVIENSKIKDVKYNGSACMISIVSSSLLSDFIKGKTLEEVQNITKDDVLNIVGLNLTTSRIKCATLVLEALQEAIKNYES